jgi:hypothetical protein
LDLALRGLDLALRGLDLALRRLDLPRGGTHVARRRGLGAAPGRI